MFLFFITFLSSARAPLPKLEKVGFTGMMATNYEDVHLAYDNPVKSYLIGGTDA